MGSGVFPQHQSALDQVLPLIQLVQMLNQQRTGQANALIAAHPKGSTVAQVGLTPDQQKAKYGRVLQPTDVTEQPTAEDAANQHALDFIQSADPATLDTISASYISRMAGVPQITTRAGLASQAKSSEINAATGVTEAQTKGDIATNQHKLVADALQSLQTWKPEVRTMLAEKTTFGTTQSDLASEGLATQVKTEVQRQILAAAANPKSDLNVALKNYTGVGIGGAMAAAGLGLTSLLTQIADLNTRIAVAGLDRDKAINDADAQWAGDVAKSLGGTASPRTILNWKRWQENGGDPKQMPRGVTPALASTLETAKDAGYKAFVTEAAQKGDVEAQTMLTLIQAAQRVGDENTLKAISQLANTYMARIVADQKIGPRPNDPAGGLRWDQIVQGIAGRMPSFTPHTIGMWKFGVDLNAPKIPNAVNTPAPNASTGQSGQLPGGQLSPEDMQNLQQIMQFLQVYQNQAAGGGVTPVAGQPPLLTPKP